MTTLLEAVDVTYSRGGRAVLAGVSVTLRAGDTLAVLGPSGSGKSSLLSLLAGLEAPDSGAVRLDGQPLQVGNIAQRRRIGLVLQGYGLLSLLTAAENVEVALQARGIARRSARGRATDLLTSLHVSDVAGKLLEKLSGGQQQRVAIARALVAEPDVVLADEPTAELDHEMQDVVISHLLAAASAGSGVVIATHDADVARRCRRQLRLRNGQLHGD